MTREEAVRQLKNQVSPNGQPASIEAVAMAVSALEEKEGGWIEQRNSRNEPIFECSECGAEFQTDGDLEFDYCPRCGAKMIEEDKHAE